MSNRINFVADRTDKVFSTIKVLSLWISRQEKENNISSENGFLLNSSLEVHLRKRIDIFSGLVISVLALAVFFYARATDTTSTIGLSPNTYPQLISGILVVCGLMQSFASYRRDYDEKDLLFHINWKTLLPVLIVLGLYVYTLNITHFIITTIPFLLIEIFLFGERRWKYIVPISVLTPIALFYLFKVFQITLPS